MSFDTVIRNGTIVDGTGLASVPRRRRHRRRTHRRRSVASRNAGDTDLDADGHVVTPGFIDGHTHMDAQVFWDELGTNSCWHGVTTVVMGHCGFTLAPALRATRASSWCATSSAPRTSHPPRSPQASTGRGPDFAEYLDTLDRIPKGINYAANIGHSALRTYVMGERAFEGEATDDDLAAMKAELERRPARRRLRVHHLADGAPPDVRRPSRRFTARLVGRGGPARRGARGPGRRQLPDRERPVATRHARQGRAVPRPLARDRRPGRPRGDERCHARDSRRRSTMPARGSGVSPIRAGSARSRRSAPNCHSTGCRSGVSFARCPVDEQQRRLRRPRGRGPAGEDRRRGPLRRGVRR